MPKGYIYAELEVTDPALFETYRPLAAASIAAAVRSDRQRGRTVDVERGQTARHAAVRNSSRQSRSQCRSYCCGIGIVGDGGSVVRPII